jgi:hypothetical protein
MQQMSLSFEPGLSTRYRSLTECVAAGVYQRGLGRVAAHVDVAPSHLSAQLSGGGEGSRKLAVETLEDYIAKEGDLTPIYYLVDKFCRDPWAQREEALAQIPQMMRQMQALLEAAAVPPERRRR